jgi:hypothetical protein
MSDFMRAGLFWFIRKQVKKADPKVGFFKQSSITWMQQERQQPMQQHWQRMQQHWQPKQPLMQPKQQPKQHQPQPKQLVPEQEQVQVQVQQQVREQEQEQELLACCKQPELQPTEQRSIVFSSWGFPSKKIQKILR